MDFYEKLELEKKKRKLTNIDLGKIIDMEGETFRIATKRQSFSNLQIKEIEKFFELDGKPDIEKMTIPSQKENDNSYGTVNMLVRSLDEAYNIIDKLREENERLKNI